MKQKPEKSPASCGKRRRTLAAQAHRNAKPLAGFVNRADRFARRFTLPAALAAVARRLGRSGVSPRDFYCGCPPCFRDGLPMCLRRRPACRFANRPSPEELAARETRADEELYEIVWEIESLSYDGPALPRVWRRRAGLNPAVRRPHGQPPGNVRK